MATGGRHLSMRVPWRDRPWDERLCESPVGNSSCLLLANIGDKRQDAYEVDHAGRTLDEVDHDRIACLSERGTFMSATGYRVTKRHPYAGNKALKGHLLDTSVVVPGHSFESVPFRWMNRQEWEEQLWEPGMNYDPEREERIHRLLSWTPGWIMDGRNQRAVIDRFYESVEPDHGLVFIYVKHSPLQEEVTRRLLIGAARVTSVTPPPMWRQSGAQPFDSMMWETIIGHSLRADQRDGVLLPYHDLLTLSDQGVEVSAGLAWAPDGRDVEFSYVTEHVSDDTAIAALDNLRAAALACRELGLQVRRSALDWLEEEQTRLWQLRGPTPGLGSALAYLGVASPHRVARDLIEVVSEDADPWPVVEDALRPTTTVGRRFADRLPASVGKTWRALDPDDRHALMVLSAMDISNAQLESIMDGGTSVPLTTNELLDNPYYAATCTYGDEHAIDFGTVDRACYPATHVTWPNIIASVVDVHDHHDRRRLEAMLTHLLEEAAAVGDTVEGQAELIGRANALVVEQRVNLSAAVLRGQELDPDSLGETWSPVTAAQFADGEPAYKLVRLAEVRDQLLDQLEPRRGGKRLRGRIDARAIIDDALDTVAAAAPPDAEEELARSEKAAGLAELHASPLTVLVGPAGTGKTTLLRALVSIPDVAAAGIHLLAPTGKARVQMQNKVGLPADTLASFLIRKGGFDHVTGRYTTVEPAKRIDAGLVVIDEMSMLTEEMLAATLSAFRRIQRLVLVGDHRQLPPIGAGRPFADIVEWLRPESFSDDGLRVGENYVELTVFRRQRTSGGSRDDLQLAQWFADGDLPGAADGVWERLRSGSTDGTVVARQWDADGVWATLTAALQDALGFVAAPDPERAFKLTYGGQTSEDGKYVNWNRGEGGAGARCEEWQILSPTRSRAFGTTELNRLLKRKFRTGDLGWASNTYGWRPPRPIGPEQIVMGDKVMQTQNRKQRAWPDGTGLNYVANGEIGVVIGRGSTTPKTANVEFSSQVGASYSYWPSRTDDPPLELAWAVTVHKSQGSEFGITFVVVPATIRLSRELIYTALTRQAEKVIILHEGTLDDFKAMASPAGSETARRLTDLFRPPRPRTVTVEDLSTRFDANLIHIGPGGVLVRSKNEVVLAQLFESLIPDQWQYEAPLRGTDGTVKYPDFTIDLPSGERIIWEHLGMMNNPRYAAAWAAKKKWYRQQGFRPYDEPDTDGGDGLLVWTDDSGGVDLPSWTELAASVIGSRPRRATKKAAQKRPNR